MKDIRNLETNKKNPQIFFALQSGVAETKWAIEMNSAAAQAFKENFRGMFCAQILW